MHERKIAIRNLSEGDPIRGVEGITKVPQHRDVCVLPDDDQRRGGEQRHRRGPLDPRGAKLWWIVSRRGRRLRLVEARFHNSKSLPALPGM